MQLVIVESPAKAKTIAGYLGAGYIVESSIGHIRDLPNRASEIPKEERQRFGTLGVDVDGDFEPYYVVDADKKRVVTDLRRLLADADSHFYVCGLKSMEEGVVMALRDIASQAGLKWDDIGPALKRTGRLHLETY